MQKFDTNVDDGIVYFNMSLENSISSSTKPILAITNQNLNVAVIPNAKEYNLAVERFSVDTSLIPIFLCPVVLGQPDINLTPFVISIQYKALSVSQPLIFFTQIADALRPTPPMVTQDFTTGYYNVSTINHMLSVINQGFFNAASAMHGLDATFPEPFTSKPSQPFISFNYTTNLFELIASESYVSNSGAYIGISAYVNTALYNYLGLQISSINLGSNDLNYLLNISSNYGGGEPYIYPTNPNVTYSKMVADHRAIDRWSPVSKILITSTSLQTRGEFIQPSVSYGQLKAIGSNSETSKIITDFEPDYYNGSIQNRNIIQYGVTGVANYRLIEFNVSGVSEIRNFNIQFWWADNYGNIYPIYLSLGGGYSLKLALINKNMIICS